jgi:lysophospholipase L1-like esterase
MGALLAVPYVSPHLRALRVGEAPPPTSETQTSGAAVTLAVGEQRLGASENTGSVTNALPAQKDEREPELDPAVLAHLAGSLAIEDPVSDDGRHAMDAFYTHLARTIRKEPGAVTRVLHYGDSLITSDFISGTMRRKMQDKYGDSGHGFILMANPWEWYYHNDVGHTASDGWNAMRITGPLTGDGMYGLGGVTFRPTGPAQATFYTKDKGDYGRNVSRFDIYYLEQPWGGDGVIFVPGRPAERFSTRGNKKVSRVKSVSVPDGPGMLTIRSYGNSDLRLFGVALERDRPGVVYDALGANGARIRLLEAVDGAHWADQMALRKPALVVMQYGTNESEDPSLDPEQYEKSLRTVLGRVKAAAADASVLVASPLDRAERIGGALKTRPVVMKIVEIQRRVALSLGCAFWSTFEAMGGEGSMGRWVQAKPQLAGWDLTHPTPEGAEVIGDLLFKAIVTGYEAFASRAPKEAFQTAPGSLAGSAPRD